MYLQKAVVLKAMEEKLGGDRVESSGISRTGEKKQRVSRFIL